MKDLKEILRFLLDVDISAHYGPRLYCELTYMDEHIDLSQWTEEDKNRLKERLIECRDNMLRNNLVSLKRVRKELKVPKERFWWYLDEL